MGRAPARVDFLQPVPGLEFASSWSSRVPVVMAGITVLFLSREDLLINKRKVGRRQDVRDVRALERTTKKKRSLMVVTNTHLLGLLVRKIQLLPSPDGFDNVCSPSGGRRRHRKILEEGRMERQRTAFVNGQQSQRTCQGELE